MTKQQQQQTNADAKIHAQLFAAAFLNDFYFKLETEHVPQYVLAYGEHDATVYYAQRAHIRPPVLPPGAVKTLGAPMNNSKWLQVWQRISSHLSLFDC
jgi:hypothetical protein